MIGLMKGRDADFRKICKLLKKHTIYVDGECGLYSSKKIYIWELLGIANKAGIYKKKEGLLELFVQDYQDLKLRAVSAEAELANLKSENDKEQI